MLVALNGALVGRVFDAAAAAKDNPCFPLHPDYCPCSAGCMTTACPRCEGPKVGAGTWHCRPSHLCNASNSVDDAVAALPPTFLSATLRVTMLAFLAFRREHIRNVFKKKPHHWRKAYAREVNRIAYLADTARAAGTRLHHAHVRLALNATEWWDVRMVHAIAQFAGRGWHIPKNITGRLRYF